eukprot:EG_transcript_22422
MAACDPVQPTAGRGSPYDVLSLASEDDDRRSHEWDDLHSSFCSSVDVLTESAHVLTPDRSVSPALLRDFGDPEAEPAVAAAVPRHQRHQALARLLLGPEAHAVNHAARPLLRPAGKKPRAAAVRFTNCPLRDAGWKGTGQRSLRVPQRRESTRHNHKPRVAGPQK